LVPIFSGAYPRGLAASASLEAAGLETVLNTTESHPYMGTPLYVTVLVRGSDFDAACAALRLSPEDAARALVGFPPPSKCAVCGGLATIHETRSEGGAARTKDYCTVHAGARIVPAAADDKDHLDEDVREAVEAINRKPGVRTVCSCSGSHAGSGEGFIALAPTGGDPESVRLFDTFLTALFMRLKEPQLRGRLSLDWNQVHGAELKLLDPARAKTTWGDLARLVSDL
jgi:hypothetical protein